MTDLTLEIYPWQQASWQRWQNMRQQQRLPHALLLTGLPGMAKYHFAVQAARLLLCEKGNLCGHCFSCQLEEITTHPDFYSLGVDEENKTIKIEQIRQLITALNQTAHKQYRVIIISPADQMNTAAYNALLKTLEEPPAGCYFWLISAHPMRLPATIRSRCQVLHMAPDFQPATLAWLQQHAKVNDHEAQTSLFQAEGSPQQALILLSEDRQQNDQRLIQDLQQVKLQAAAIIPIAKRWQLYGLVAILDQLLCLFAQALQQPMQPTLSSNLALELKLWPLKKISDFMQIMLHTKKQLTDQPNLNAQLLAESLLIKWYEYQK